MKPLRIKLKGAFSKLSWPVIITEFFSVLLAVLLAFLLTEWRTENVNRATAKVALQSI